jgi:C-terminal processing protease CtpA/Prc
MFTAVLRDSGAAKTIGAATFGAGGGSMSEEPPITLPTSRLRFTFPNTVRLRADGTDEVAGIVPDLPVLATEGEDGRARALRILDSIDADLRKARQ